MGAAALGGQAGARERRAVIAVYVLYLIGFVVWPLALAGFAVALVKRGRSGTVWDSHFRFQVRTAILLLVYVAAVILLMWMTAGPLRIAVNLGAGITGIAMGFWWIGRAVVGLLKAMEDTPVPRPDSLMFGG
jgi:uncharacterized membrane protein